MPDLAENKTEGESILADLGNGILVDRQEKYDFFNKFALAHFEEMRFLFKKGRLWKREKWGNVARHCLVVGIVCDQIAEMLGIAEDDRKKIVRTGLIHDVGKRKEKEMINNTKKEEILESISEASAETTLELRHEGYQESIVPISYLSDEKIGELEKRIKEGDIDLETLILYYSDGITSSSNVVSVEQRVADLRKRYPVLNTPRNELKGRSYLDAQEDLLITIESILKKHMKIEEEKPLPLIILERIALEIGSEKYEDR